jgi:hypothetical protein
MIIELEICQERRTNSQLETWARSESETVVRMVGNKCVGNKQRRELDLRNRDRTFPLATTTQSFVVAMVFVLTMELVGFITVCLCGRRAILYRAVARHFAGPVLHG